jgi:LPXTG-motif cell wall-anchored protein
MYEPVLQPNPYTDDYTYTDGAYFGDLPEEELAKIFEEIYQSSMTMSPYGFVLYKNSSVNVVDNIGEGMEIKGTPVLRYNGVNYTNPSVIQSGNSVTYVYSGTVTDPYIPNRSIELSEITVNITTSDDGTQTVYWYVPDTALPTYTPELIGQQFYYEQLPVRLLYQVGLTEEAQADVLALSQTGGQLVYYTNKWENDADISTSTLLPSTANPFYYDADGDGIEPPYHAHHNLKTENTTDTIEYHVDCQRSIDTVAGEVLVEVLHKQGNNGKLVFEAETVEIAVEKKWDEGINADIMNPVEAVVYKVTETVDKEGTIIRNAVQVNTLTLSASNRWKAVLPNLQQPDGEWYYVLAESLVAGYSVAYDHDTTLVTTDGGDTFFKAVKLDDTVTAITMTNSVAVQLPSTGGGGTFLYTLGGLLLMAAAILWYSFDCKRRREESTPH